MKSICLLQRRYFKLFIMFFALLNIGTQCDKEPIEFQYHFLEQVDAYPIAVTNHLKDTIWIDYKNIDSKYFDQKTNQRVAQDSVRFWLTINYVATDRSNFNYSVKQTYCDFVVSANAKVDLDGGESTNSAHLSVTCSSKPHFKVGIVPRIKGNYKISFSDQGYIYSCTSKPISANPSLINYQFSNGQSNVFLNVAE